MGRATRDEIWAIGLRNPWRFSFDRLNGDLWLGDVGQYLWEEIDHELPADGGHNYAWNCYEGTHPYGSNPSQPHCIGRTFTWPVYEYQHARPLFSQRRLRVPRIAQQRLFWPVRVLRLLPDQWRADVELCRQQLGGGQLHPRAAHRSRHRSSERVRPGHHRRPLPGRLLVHRRWLYRLNLRPANCTAGHADVNGDGQVDVVDVQLVAADFGRPDFVPDYDVDCNGVVDVADVQAVALAWEA
ncbi:MAG: PQQ-dependent sugar dehydrogenase [Anaerolineae bacterium]|nr:MAG: PQQ-dependent sugar dehydrogenase [Anaerolineae bacterium]